jgi:LysR family transcriptional regulator, nod-box dependent transcriptional activator
MLNRFDLNLLAALDALLHEKNVTRAAQRVYVSQPTMSAALAKLREFFDDDLLVRVGREMELTPRGLALVEPVRAALLGVQAALGTQPHFDPATASRRFRLMIHDFMAPRLLPPVIARIAREAPGIGCHLEQFSQLGIGKLEHAEIDLVVGIDNAQLFGLREFPEELRSVELEPVRWVCAVSADHPTIRDSLSREQFLELPHIFARRSGDLGPVADAVRRFIPADLDVRVTSESVLQVALILAGTPCLAILPESVVRYVAPLVPLKTFTLPVPVPDTRVVALWHKRSEADPCHAWLRNAVIAAGRTR